MLKCEDIMTREMKQHHKKVPTTEAHERKALPGTCLLISTNIHLCHPPERAKEFPQVVSSEILVTHSVGSDPQLIRVL
jgi:hypothetical protein